MDVHSKMVVLFAVVVCPKHKKLLLVTFASIMDPSADLNGNNSEHARLRVVERQKRIKVLFRGRVGNAPKGRSPLEVCTHCPNCCPFDF